MAKFRTIFCWSQDSVRSQPLVGIFRVSWLVLRTRIHEKRRRRSDEHRWGAGFTTFGHHFCWVSPERRSSCHGRRSTVSNALLRCKATNLVLWVGVSGLVRNKECLSDLVKLRGGGEWFFLKTCWCGAKFLKDFYDRSDIGRYMICWHLLFSLASVFEFLADVYKGLAYYGEALNCSRSKMFQQDVRYSSSSWSRLSLCGK